MPLCITYIRQIGQNLFWSSCGLSIILTCSCLPTWASRQTHSLPVAAWPEVMQTNCVSTLYLQSISWIFGGPVTASLERPACFEPLHSLALLLLLSIQCNFIIEAWKTTIESAESASSSSPSTSASDCSKKATKPSASKSTEPPSEKRKDFDKFQAYIHISRQVIS